MYIEPSYIIIVFPGKKWKTWCIIDLGFDDMCQVPTAVYDKDTTHPFPAFCLSGTLPE